MANIAFDYEWIDPGTAQGLELRATWARFRILVDNKPVTRVFDEVSRTIRESVYSPLYPLAEWLATNWWTLFGEIRSSDRVDATYCARHSLRQAREGFALPNVSVESEGGALRVSWQPEKLPHSRLEFVDSGSAFIRIEHAQKVFSDLLSSVVERLEEFDVHHSLLQEEWSNILATSADEREFCVAAAALGLDPYAVDEATARDILRAGLTLPSDVQTEFFAAARAEALQANATQIAGAIETSRSNAVELQLRKLANNSPLSHLSEGPPWRQGYVAARELREQLHLDQIPIPTFDSVAKALGTEPMELRRAIYVLPFDAAFEGVVAANASNSPGFVIRTSLPETQQRFALCRELFEYLASPKGVPSVITSTASDRQKCNRAFAAEFLAPSEALRSRLKNRWVSGERVNELGNEFGVSALVIQHQLENHKIAAVVRS